MAKPKKDAMSRTAPKTAGSNKRRKSTIEQTGNDKVAAPGSEPAPLEVPIAYSERVMNLLDGLPEDEWTQEKIDEIVLILKEGEKREAEFSDDLFSANPTDPTDDEIEVKIKQARPVVNVVLDESQQVIRKRIAQAESETPWMQSDPFKEALLQIKHLLPDEGRGMRFKFLADRITARKGRRNWEPFNHPETGEPIKVQGLTLCWMPEIAAERRTKHYQEIGNEAIREAQETYEQNVKDLSRDAERQGVHGITPLDRDDVLTQRNPRARDFGHEERIGVGVTRGELQRLAGQNGVQMTPEIERAIQAEVQRRMEAMDRAG